MKREDLFEYKHNKEWLETRKTKIESEYENIRKMITTYQDRNKYSLNSHDPMAQNLSILLDMKLEALNFAIKLEQNLKKVDHALSQIKQPYRNILTDVYIHGDSLDTVANHMNYNDKYMSKKHREALKKYDEL